MRTGYTCAMAPFVCPVNYSRSKLSGNEVPGSCPGPSLASKVLPSAHPRGERTNKSTSVLRRDIVSCEVNHLYVARKYLPPPRSSRHELLMATTFVTFFTAMLHRHDRHKHCLHSSCSGPVSVNSQTYAFVISVIQVLTAAQPKVDPLYRRRRVDS